MVWSTNESNLSPYADDQAPDYAVWNERQQHRDEKRFDRVEALEFDELVDHVNRDSEKKDPRCRVRPLIQARYPLRRLCQKGSEEWGACAPHIF
jgi:hypothetical protein